MTMVTRHRRRPDERGRYWALCDVRGDQSAEGGLIAAAARRAFCCITFHISAEVESEFVGIHERWRERAKVVLRKGPDRGSIKEPKTAKPFREPTPSCDHKRSAQPFQAPNIRRTSTNCPRW